jgi:N-acetylglucosaminyldiphosphoundecaprenol N-acetyl-beta-D-mannosaminyltransferase
MMATEEPKADTMPEKAWAFGLPLMPFTMQQTVDAVRDLIDKGEPSYFITANLNYAMLSDGDPELQRINNEAAFVLADGMPLVWAANRNKTPLPERVAGSDLIYALAEAAGKHRWRIFFIGAAEGVAAEAAQKLQYQFPGLEIAGVEVPPYRKLTESEESAMFERIRSSNADLLIGAFSQPAGEKWVAANHQKLNIPVCVQLGATLDFVAGRVRRSPSWLAKFGLEWAFRLAVEPRRLAKRYLKNSLFLARQVLYPSTSKSN